MAKKKDSSPTKDGVGAALKASERNFRYFNDALEQFPELSRLSRPLADFGQEFRGSSALGAYRAMQGESDKRASRAGISELWGEDPGQRNGLKTSALNPAMALLGSTFGPKGPLMTRGDKSDEELRNSIKEARRISHAVPLAGTATSQFAKSLGSYLGSEFAERERLKAENHVASVERLSYNQNASFHENAANLRGSLIEQSDFLSSKKLESERMSDVLTKRDRRKIESTYGKGEARLNRDYRNSVLESAYAGLSSAKTNQEKRAIFSTLKSDPAFLRIAVKGLSALDREEKQSLAREEKTAFNSELEKLTSSMMDPSIKVGGLQDIRAKLAQKLESSEEGSYRRSSLASSLSKVDKKIFKQTENIEKEKFSGAMAELRADYADRTKFGKKELPARLDYLKALDGKAKALGDEFPEKKEIVFFLRSIAASTKKTEDAIKEQNDTTKKKLAQEEASVKKLEKDYPIASILAPLLSKEWKDKEAAAGGDGGSPFDSKEKKKILQRYRRLGKGALDLAEAGTDAYIKYQGMRISLPRETAEAQFRVSGMQNKMMLESMAFTPTSLVKYAGDVLYPTAGNPFIGKEGIQRAGVYAEAETRRAQDQDKRNFWKTSIFGGLGVLAAGAVGGPIGLALAGGALLGTGSSLMDNRYLRSSGIMGSDIANKEKALYQAETMEKQIGLVEASMQQQQMKVAGLSSYFSSMEATRSAALAVGGGRAISAHLVGRGVLSQEIGEIRGTNYGGLPMSKPGDNPNPPTKSVLEGTLSEENTIDVIKRGGQYDLKPYSNPQAGLYKPGGGFGYGKTGIPTSFGNEEDRIAEQVTSDVERRTAQASREVARGGAMVASSIPKVIDSEWFFKYGISPAERTSMAASVVPNMGGGLGTNAGAVQNTSDSLTRQLFELSLGGVGSFEQQSANMGRISAISGKSGQQSFNELKKIMAEAVGIGMDNSKTGQSFAQTAIEMAAASKMGDPSAVARQLASLSSGLGGTGKDAERVQGTVQEGLAGMRQSMQNPAIEGLHHAKMLYAGIPRNYLTLVDELSKDPNTMATVIPELIRREKTGKSSVDLGLSIEGALKTGLTPKMLREGASGRFQSIMSVGRAMGGEKDYGNAKKAILDAMSGKANDKTYGLIQAFAGNVANIAGTSLPAAMIETVLDVMQSPEGMKIGGAGAKGMKGLMDLVGGSKDQVKATSAIKAAQNASAAAMSALFGGQSDKTYKRIIEENMKSDPNNPFKGTLWENASPEEKKIKSKQIQESFNGGKLGDTKDAALNKELEMTPDAMALKKAVEASQFGSEGQRVTVTNAWEIGFHTAAYSRPTFFNQIGSKT
jgi:hypothetical protein